MQGKALSYNNLLDLDAAWRAVVSFEKPTICIVKHLSPCGIASAEGLRDAFTKALASDPVSAFGGVVAANRFYDEDAAHALGDLFVECIAAPGFSRGALDALSSRKNLRLVSMPDVKIEPPYELRSVNQGLLRQTVDFGDPASAEWRVVTHPPAHPGRVAVAAFRLESLPARQVQRHRFRPGRGHGWHRRRPAQPCGLRAHRRPARRRTGARGGHGVRRLFPLP